MNIQPEIKSRCQGLLMEQEMGRREIRKLISRVTDPTKCLEAYGWKIKDTASCTCWYKIFTFPYPLRVMWHGQVYLQREVIIPIFFSYWYVSLDIRQYPEFKVPRIFYSSYVIYTLKSKLKTDLILRKFAVELPKIIASAKTESFYDEEKQKQVKVIPILDLIVKIEHIFNWLREINWDVAKLT